MIEQKYVRYARSWGRTWLLGDSGSSSYMASQHEGGSGLEQDLKMGWVIKFCWEDAEQIVLILERSF